MARPRNVNVKPCGTVAAYHRHRYYGEEPCPEDRAAWSAWNRAYNKARRTPKPKPEPEPKPKRVRPKPERKWRTYDRTRDLLFLDGGWLTSEGIAVDLGCDPATVERALRRLRREGLVESRLVGLASADRRNRDKRTEWKSTEDPCN